MITAFNNKQNEGLGLIFAGRDNTLCYFLVDQKHSYTPRSPEDPIYVISGTTPRQNSQILELTKDNTTQTARTEEFRNKLQKILETI